MGDRRYSRRAEPLSGDQPWVALIGAVPDNQEHARAAWPNRALIVRGWQARLGGQEIAEPHYSVRGTDNRTQSAQVELSAPADIKRLEVGDFVEMWLELDVLPQAADDYFGPSQGLRDRLEQLTPAQLVQSIAHDGRLSIEVAHGTLESGYLPRIRANADPAAPAAAEFTLHGGWGFAPLTISGLPRPDGWILEAWENEGWSQLDPTPTGEFQRQTDWAGQAEGYVLSYTLARPTSNTLRLRLRQKVAE